MVVDANVWISAFIGADVNHGPSEAWRQSWIRAQPQLVLPILILAEVASAMSRRIGNPLIASGFAAALSSEPRIHLRDIDRDLGEKAARVASRHRLRGADAVYVALAADLGVPLVTWDQEILARAAGLIDVRTPDQLPV